MLQLLASFLFLIEVEAKILHLIKLYIGCHIKRANGDFQIYVSYNLFTCFYTTNTKQECGFFHQAIDNSNKGLLMYV